MPKDPAPQTHAARPKVHGLDVTDRTQCAHWSSDRDIIAIKHRCCGAYYACVSCHEAVAGHDARVWARDERDTPAVLCGNCGRELTVAEYLGCANSCPGCRAGFNPGCARHYELYFEM